MDANSDPSNIAMFRFDIACSSVAHLLLLLGAGDVANDDFDTTHEKHVDGFGKLKHIITHIAAADTLCSIVNGIIFISLIFLVVMYIVCVE
mmetsp:Transcript_6616/g.8939  ORF Transcript_6616/g.8939 Transcript_6616/m.8939 type:complete len:91 (+) Transcript_6616:727-999(+)